MIAAQVADSEHAVLTIARALVGSIDRDVAWPLLVRERALPQQLGPTAAGLLDETLRRGLWRLLARAGAAPTTSLDERGELRRGRLWQRHPPTPLFCSSATVALLRWLAATPLVAPPSTLTTLSGHGLFSTGDQLIAWLALDLVAPTAAVAAVARQVPVRVAPLAWLGFADALAAVDGPEGPPDADAFAPLTTGAGALVVEALTPALARRWRAVERGKAHLVAPAALQALGDAQDAVLTAWMTACTHAGRRDLAGFILDAAAPLLAGPLPPASLPGASLDSRTSLSARAGARRAGGALLRAVGRWQAWDDEHRSVRFIDDGYTAAQHLLARYELVGAPGAGVAVARLDQLTALTAAAAPTAPT